MAATLPSELAHWVTLWAHNPADMPKPIPEDEFGHLDLGDLNVWLWSCTMAPETHKGTFIHTMWNIFLTPGRWADLVGDNSWALPVANNLHNNVIAHWAWQEGSMPDGINPQFLV